MWDLDGGVGLSALHNAVAIVSFWQWVKGESAALELNLTVVAAAFSAGACWVRMSCLWTCLPVLVDILAPAFEPPSFGAASNIQLCT